MQIKTEPFVKVRLKLMEELLRNSSQVALDGDYADLAYASGKVAGIIEAFISANPEQFVTHEKDHQLAEEDNE